MTKCKTKAGGGGGLNFLGRHAHHFYIRFLNLLHIVSVSINICTKSPVPNQCKNWGQKAESLGFESRKMVWGPNTP